ncbi:hypothetical protein K474DRAFT_1776783 [Panus rudis PR-1116 ss-1]|nr:hypothetical protein K474DRAFT_1776783 [Panus rudis PR-1116 ss-1]
MAGGRGRKKKPVGTAATRTSTRKKTGQGGGPASSSAEADSASAPPAASATTPAPDNAPPLPTSATSSTARPTSATPMSATPAAPAPVHPAMVPGPVQTPAPLPRARQGVQYESPQPVGTINTLSMPTAVTGNLENPPAQDEHMCGASTAPQQESTSPTAPSIPPLSLSPPPLHPIPAVREAIEPGVSPALQGTPSRLPKRKNIPHITDIDDETLKEWGRMYLRLGEPWDQLSKVIEEGVKHEIANLPGGRDEDSSSDDDSSDEEDGSTSAADAGTPAAGTGTDSSASDRETKRARRLASWRILCEKIPRFREEMVDLVATHNPKGKMIISKMHEARQGTRSDDTSGLKKVIHDYVHADTNRALNPKLTSKKEKSLRGWNHLELAHMLLPLQYEASPTLLEEIKNGTVIITADDWMRFLYPDGRQYEEHNELPGLFRGHLLLRVMKHIYTGPSTWNKGPGHQTCKLSNAQRMDMGERVTARAIAYAAVQARVAICSASEWSTEDMDFSHEEFYWAVVETIEDESEANEHQDRAVQTQPSPESTIDYFNRKLFRAVAATDSRRQRQTPAQRAREQRKRARISASS